MKPKRNTFATFLADRERRIEGTYVDIHRCVYTEKDLRAAYNAGRKHEKTEWGEFVRGAKP